MCLVIKKGMYCKNDKMGLDLALYFSCWVYSKKEKISLVLPPHAIMMSITFIIAVISLALHARVCVLRGVAVMPGVVRCSSLRRTMLAD